MIQMIRIINIYAVSLYYFMDLLKGSWYFLYDTKHNVHGLHMILAQFEVVAISLKKMILSLNDTKVSFWEISKTSHENKFVWNLQCVQFLPLRLIRSRIPSNFSVWRHLCPIWNKPIHCRAGTKTCGFCFTI